MGDFARIFLSYRRSDSEADAGRLGDTLRRILGDERVFTDAEDIEFGANWERVVDHTLQDCVALLLVIGPAWKLTDSIKYEVGLALNSGISIIPILVRGGKWPSPADDLPSNLQSLRKLNAIALDHSNWTLDVSRVSRLLEKMLADPLRARVICTPPDPLSVLNTALDRENVRSLLVHAADLAECLDDASVLTEAQQAAPKSSLDSRENRTGEQTTSQLVYVLGNARYRLMIEQIGRDLLKYSSWLEHSSGEHAARYLQDAELEKEVRRNWEEFEEVKSACSAARGDIPENPKDYQTWAIEADERARNRLREQLPGLTKPEPTRQGLFQLVENQVKAILSKKRIEDMWEYIVLKHFGSYPDMPLEIRDSSRTNVCEMLEGFKTSQLVRHDYGPDW
jgi:hypothetical protein